MAALELSARDARRAQLVAQGLLGRRQARDPAAIVDLTRGVQLDTISVLARSHELIAFARVGVVPRRRIEDAYWKGPPYRTFEYWYHAACIVPIEEWPNLAFKRNARRERGYRWHQMADSQAACSAVVDQIRERGPLTARELGGAKRGGPWWDWSETKIAAEWLLDVGELVCMTRRSYQRVYDLSSRAVPPELFQAEVGRKDAIRILVERAAGALGVSTAADIAAYAGLKRPDVLAALQETALEPAVVEGWRDGAIIGPGALDHRAVSGSSRARPVMLSPFDSLICDRARLERVFGFHHRLEAYVPRPKRIHGYYSMPVLAGDRLVGRVDPGRVGTTLVARSVHLESAVATRAAVQAVAGALLEAARWVGSSAVAVERVEPAEEKDALVRALAAEPSPG
ncbi:MAG: winged helix-turn-helix domain-containing protein [Acidimicrobiales bacterium]